jgi:hypothetical protein
VSSGISASGYFPTSLRLRSTSALPPEADIVPHRGDVGFGPISDIGESLGLIVAWPPKPFYDYRGQNGKAPLAREQHRLAAIADEVME